MTDIQAIQLILSGEVDAFETIIRRYHKRIYNLIYRLVWNKEEAEDITQEIFMKGFRALRGFNKDMELYPWLHKIAVNTTYTHLKRNQKKQREHEYRDEFHGKIGRAHV